MKELQKLPVTQSGFEAIREEGLLYVDKTQQMLRLINQGKYLFLSRPRRFGKSMLINTLKALYEGKKHLFEGLYVYDKWQWEVYPVILLDFSVVNYRRTLDIFDASMLFRLKRIARQYGLTLTAPDYMTAMSELMFLLREKIGRKVVILIDEYDKPITDFINSPDKAERNREVLKAFYGMLKGEHEYIHKIVITGVSKLAKVSVFSGMNNVSDISLMPAYNDLLGLTQADIEHYFGDYLTVLAQKFDFSHAELMESIRLWYNGYTWDGVNRVYNPYSMINLFNQMEFKNFWFQSGTPTMLIDLIVQKAYAGDERLKKQPTDYERVRVTEDVFDAAELSQLSIEGLLFQTGYLTIAGIEKEGLINYYILDFPNFEVKWSFMAQILEKYAQMPRRDIEPGALLMKRALRLQDRQEFLKLLKAYFAVIPYQLRQKADEAYYHSLFQMVFTLIGIDMVSEKSLIDGRIDGILEFDDKVYIVEFKYARKGWLKTLVNNALKQIKQKEYAKAYANTGKAIYLVGIGFLEKNKDQNGRTKLEIDARFEEWQL